MKNFLLAVWILIFLFAPATGPAEQLYQYRDQEGQLHFTDDQTQIPENATEIETKALEASEPAVEKRPDTPKKQRYEASPAPAQDSSDNAPEPQLEMSDAEIGQITAEQLDREKERLDQRLEALQVEKAKLDGVSTEGMTHRQLNTYEHQVRDLNARIEEHKAEQRAFQKKVEAFNARLKQKEAGGPEEAPKAEAPKAEKKP